MYKIDEVGLNCWSGRSLLKFHLGLKQYSVMNAMPRNVSYVNPQAETILREKVAQQVH